MQGCLKSISGKEEQLLYPGQILASPGELGTFYRIPLRPGPESSEVFLAKQMKRSSSQNVNEQMKQSRRVKSNCQFPHTSLPHLSNASPLSFRDSSQSILA